MNKEVTVGTITPRKFKLKKQKKIKKSGVEKFQQAINIKEEIIDQESLQILKSNKSKKKKIQENGAHIQVKNKDQNELWESSVIKEENVKNEKRPKKVKKNKLKHVTVKNTDEVCEKSNTVNLVAKKQKKRKLLDTAILDSNDSGTEEPKKKKKVSKNKRNHITIKKINEEVSEESTTANLVVKKPKKQKRKILDTDILDSDDSDTEEPKKKKKIIKDSEIEKKVVEDPELKARTVFVGNVPLKCSKKSIKKLFRKYGIIDSLRIRGIPVANPKMTKKVAVIKQEFHPERNNVLCYIR